MIYYVTGASGFIGKRLMKLLPDAISLMDAEPDGITPFTVIHLAAYGNHVKQTNRAEIVNANIGWLLKMISKYRLETLVRFINVSTSSVTLPVQTMYSASKLLGETIINSLKDERFFNVRPYSVYGPEEADHRFIPTVIRHLHSGEVMQLDTMATHDWIFVDDFIQAMLSIEPGQQVYPIGTGVKHTNYEVVKMLESISGKKLNFEDKTMREYDNDNWVSPVRVPHRMLFEGLRETYESFTRKDN